MNLLSDGARISSRLVSCACSVLSARLDKEKHRAHTALSQPVSAITLHSRVLVVCSSALSPDKGNPDSERLGTVQRCGLLAVYMHVLVITTVCKNFRSCVGIFFFFFNSNRVGFLVLYPSFCNREVIIKLNAKKMNQEWFFI